MFKVDQSITNVAPSKGLQYQRALAQQTLWRIHIDETLQQTGMRHLQVGLFRYFWDGLIDLQTGAVDDNIQRPFDCCRILLDLQSQSTQAKAKACQQAF